MSGGRGLLTAVATAAAALTAAPGALAAQGTEYPGHQQDVTYTADLGEANQLVVNGAYDAGHLHLHDSGAVIHWSQTQVTPECSTVTDHDVLCTDNIGSGFELDADLGDGNDSFTNLSADYNVNVKLGPGDDKAVGGAYYGANYRIDPGPGADDVHGGSPADVIGPETPPVSFIGGGVVDYGSATGPVTVTADDVANDGQDGEHDNIHSDVGGVYGGPFDNTITGFHYEIGGGGNDHLTGTAGNDLIFDSSGNDVLTGGPGSDTLWDTAGDNTFYAQDGQADHIYCGTGYDIVYADPQDTLKPADNGGGPCDEVHIG